MKHFIFLRILCILHVCDFIQFIKSISLNDTETLYRHLETSSSHIKPRLNQTENVIVDILLFINSIQSYDVVSGSLVFTGAFAMYWKDDTKVWNPKLYGGIKYTDFPVSKTWTPRVLIRNGVDRISVFRFDDEFNIQKSSVTYHYSGAAKVTTTGLYQVICQSDVLYFPKDEHKCKIIATTAYLLNDVKLTSKNGIYRKAFIPSAEWFIQRDYTVASQLDIEVTKTRKTTQDQIEFTIFVKRKYIFALVNVIVPIIVLSLAHFLVFLLPVESGERTSFSFTLFLTLVVFMTIVSDKLPPSDSISVFNVFLLHQLLSSVFTTALTVFSIRLYYRETYNTRNGPLYRLLLKVYQKMCTDSCSLNRETDENTSDTWKRVSQFFDRLCVRVLSTCFVIELAIYAIIIAQHT